LCGIERADSVDASFDLAPDPNITELLGAQIQEATTPDIDCDDTTLRVDRNYNYTVHISYAEVYNEKIYDLLGSISSKPAKSGLPRTTTGPTLLMRQALNLKSSPPSDGSNGKYIDGLKELRIHSAEQGKALIKLGQLHRTVFGTLANQESSRSHGIVTIKVVRCHRGERHVSNLINPLHLVHSHIFRTLQPSRFQGSLL
jgi:kinesin family protein 20